MHNTIYFDPTPQAKIGQERFSTIGENYYTEKYLAAHVKKTSGFGALGISGTTNVKECFRHVKLYGGWVAYGWKVINIEREG